MAKTPPKIKTVIVEEWQYEHAPFEGEPNPYWIVEDDERSASYKAVNAWATGRIRSRQVTRRVGRHFDQMIDATSWVVKQQTLIQK